MDTLPPLTDHPDQGRESEWNDPTQDDMTITLIKQYTYCPRIAYFETCTPDVRPLTYKMEAGAKAHEHERKRASRRTLFAYQVPEGTRHFDVRLRSETLGLVGVVDEVVVTPDQAIVVDYKMADRSGENHQMQLAAYAMLASEKFSLPIYAGYVYLLNTKRFEKVAINEVIRNSVLEAISAINKIRFHEYMPPPTPQRNKCATCEFRRFCNDV
jgi:CRISPR-associated exonuclease Cas4